MFTLLDVSKYCGMTSLSSAASTSEQSQRLESTLSVLRAAVTENRVIPERELDILTKQAELIGKRFSFLEIPDFWPLSLAKEMVSIIPEEYSTLLHSVNVELVVDNDINAIAYSHTKSVQLLQGLPSFVTLGVCPSNN